MSALTGNIVALGNSITQGAGLSATQNYPALLTASLGSAWQVFNAGHSGETTPQLLANFANYAQVHYTSRAVRNILVVNEVGNDLIGGASEDERVCEADRLDRIAAELERKATRKERV